MIRFHWKHIAIGLAILPFVAVVAAWIGFFNVGASTGHWRMTEWFLHFAMRSAVRTYALAVELPETLPRAGVQPAAGHFATGCAICHGAPGEPRSPAAMGMLPQPPDLAEVVDTWSDAELFRIVKHGVRFTGMPAWPTQERDDEVWAMVAFLRELPGMDAETYRGLAFVKADRSGVDPAHGLDAVLADCARCHGSDGLGRSPAVPALAGQGERYLLESLRAYAGGARPSGIMEMAVSGVAPEMFGELARFYSRLAWRASQEAPSTAFAGRRIFEQGVPARRVPACAGCHRPIDRHPRYPEIRGQSPSFLENQLRLFRDGKRGGSDYAHLMTNAAAALSDDDIDALASFLSRHRD